MSFLYKEIELTNSANTWDIKFDYHDSEYIKKILGTKYPKLSDEIIDFIKFYDWNFKNKEKKKIKYNIFDLWQIHNRISKNIGGEKYE